jgi:hypothetical protein
MDLPTQGMATIQLGNGVTNFQFSFTYVNYFIAFAQIHGFTNARDGNNPTWEWGN